MAAALLVAACASPITKIDTEIERAGFARSIVAGQAYRHVVLDNGIRDAARPLDVYIEGDGSPYHGRYLVAADPTPRHPLMLGLMQLDRGPAVYVGRPCYLGLAADPPCRASDWTLGRFSEEIVSSLAAVIEQLAVERAVDRVVLLGHSGGGALAVLLARRLPQVVRVVTIAGNLDPTRWTALHHFAPLADSLDPLAGGPLPPSIEQLHLAGAQDENIPPSLIIAAAERLGGGEVRVVPGATHTHGWSEVWPAALAGQ
jgi:pimeloyl-ACP methyl ester carboxylesterase